MLTHFKNFAGGGVYPVISDNDAAHFVAFIGMLGVLTATPALSFANGDRDRAAIACFVVFWWLAALIPLLTLDGFFETGVLYRKLYVLGPSLGILLAMLGQTVLRSLPEQARLPGVALASVTVLLALTASAMLAAERRDDVTALATSWETYVSEMRGSVQDVPRGGTLYVVGAPPLIRSFDDIYTVASAQTYYGFVDARSIKDDEIERLAPHPPARIFRYPRS
jgi:hypothetical protein